jgi:diguanylate cyclase (GGDEF)-like protein/PAS domain S-box-containing protein
LKQQQALRESEIKFHTMLDWTYDWEYWISPAGRIHYMTPSVERITGYLPAAFQTAPDLIDQIVHPDDRLLWDRHKRHYLAGSGSAEVEEFDMRIVHRDGSIVWVIHTCRPLFGADGSSLGRRVTVRDIGARKAAEDQIRTLAYFDPLTGLPNRRLLLDRLGHALIACQRSREYGALMILDLDHFKALNDTRGHDLGDQLLIDVARRLQASVRQVDTVSRLGGDEYVVLLEGLGNDEQVAAKHAEDAAEKVRQSLGQLYRLPGMALEHHSTASIGLTLFGGTASDQERTVDGVLKQADVALYQAKDAGRNVVRFFNPAMQALIDARAAMEDALRRALREGELHLYYQPQVDLHGQLIGAEALLRWLPPDSASVPPASFIPLAEDTGLILPIGQWVLDTACAQLKIWEAYPATAAMILSVNVSARQFLQADFVAQVRASLARSGASPTRLALELTESVLLENVEEAILRMQQLRALGIGFALDDFGTGYSSLSYLKRLPLDQVKIDQSFVRDVNHDPNDAAIVRAILAMSRSLGLGVIAEGVETEAQYAFLSENGCTEFQGYWFGKPLPIEEWNRRWADLPVE